ncbi:hypothetical protein D3C85_1634130 [compost metagenome]
MALLVEGTAQGLGEVVLTQAGARDLLLGVCQQDLIAREGVSLIGRVHIALLVLLWPPSKEAL